MVRKTKIKTTRVRLRRQSYFKRVEPFATEWYINTNPGVSDNTLNRSTSVIVSQFLYSEYKLQFRSTSMRRIKGEKINKQGSWSIRVDFFDSFDSKLFTLFCLKFAPTVVDKTWFAKKTDFIGLNGV